MKPVCMRCGLFFKPKKNGVVVEEGMPEGDAWKPYKLWMGDLYECRGCGYQMATGFGSLPVSEHYLPEYAGWKEKYPPIIFVGDC